MFGTFLNVAAILAGSAVGVLSGGRLPERMRSTVMDVLGLFTVVLGVSGALTTFGEPLREVAGRGAALVVLGVLIVGAIIGETLDLDARLNQVGAALQRLVSRSAGDRVPVPVGGPSETPDDDRPPTNGSRFTEGFVVASLVFSIGPLAILGPIADGLTGDWQLLGVKAALDGSAAVAFASALGIGVAFSALPVLLLQGAVALSAGVLDGLLTDPMVAAMDAVGGLIVVAIGLRLLEVRQIRVANLLPAIALAPLAVALVA